MLKRRTIEELIGFNCAAEDEKRRLRIIESRCHIADVEAYSVNSKMYLTLGFRAGVNKYFNDKDKVQRVLNAESYQDAIEELSADGIEVT